MSKARRQPSHKATAVVPERRPWACAAVLVVATFLTFMPAFHAEFIRWDDPQYVSENALLRSPGGLAAIWTPLTKQLPQYYPLTFSSYWIEYQLWQLTPAGYHATNVVLHAINAVLVMQLIHTLGASPWIAFGAAAMFALHPAQVESVMWVTERKNTLSGCFFLVAFLLYLRHRRSGRWGWYGASLAAFASALLSKTQTVSLPVILCLTEWLLQRSGRLQRLGVAAIAGRVLPMVGLGLVSAWLTTAVERQMTLSWVELPSLLQRVLIAANAPWYYLGCFLFPVDLPPIVPKWVVSVSAPQWWLGLLAWGIVAALILRWYRRLDDFVVWGAAEFMIALLPAIGLVPFAYQHYTYVAMRFLYLSCIGGGVVLATLTDRLAGPGWTTRRSAVAALGAAVLLACGALTARAATRWQTNLSFWSYAVALNPQSYPANLNLGLHYESTKEWADAVRYYRGAYELRPMDTYALTRYLRALSVVGGAQAVVDASDAELRRSNVNAFVAHFYRAMGYEQLGRRDDAIRDYQRTLALTRQGSTTWKAARQALQRLGQAPGS
jgi:hypothetical protein